MSQISPLMFFPSEKEFFSWIYLLKKTHLRTKTLMSPVWHKILKIWDTLYELVQIEVQSSNNYFKKCLPQEAEAFGNNIEKEPQKPRQKLKKICILNIYREYLLGSFLQKCISFLEQRLRFSHFQVSIIL